MSSTTKVPSSTPPSFSNRPSSILSGCEVNGTVYPEGERIEKMENQCEHCYCMKGKIMCDPIVCKVPVNNLCTPVHSNGHCCPTSYNCSSMEDNRHSIAAEEVVNEVSDKGIIEEITWPSNETITEIITSNAEETTTDISKEINETEINTTTAETTEFTTVTTFNDTEERSVVQNEIIEAENLTGDNLNSENVSEVATTAMIVADENTTISTNISNNFTSPVRSIPDVIEAIINRTLEKDIDYEYDYNESSLPPSLPNLKIIPFVAADAVVNEPDDMYSGKSRTSESPIYFDIPLTNRFSPPAETEGGFMPRDPIIDGPFYETKFDEPFTSGNPGILLEHTSETLLPPITEPPKLFEEAKCLSKGRTYHHGEVVSEPNACELCVCYYGDVHCQKPKCTPLNAGCRRVQDVKNACCGRVVCESDIKMNPVKEEVTPSTFLPESLSNLPAITVADVIVTPNPFKDVIRTEPAPDLVHIMKDMIPHLQETVGNIKHDFSVNINNGSVLNVTEPSFTKLINEASTKIPTKSVIKTEEASPNNTKIDEDYEDTFSFSSVLDLLFNGDFESNSTKIKPTTVTSITTSPTEQNKIEHKTVKLSNDINQESTDSNVVINDKKDVNNKMTNNIKKNGEKQNLTANVHLNSANGTMISLDNSIENLRPTTEIIPTITTPKSNVTNNNQSDISLASGTPTGLLKLAGCNIYGRMYRVGRIISELSGPCLECMCTEVGVQCKQLAC
ncbi:uncharacterized protein isoform X3 [Rhodnius prolixus]